jgi:hypothetical protein
MSSLLRMNNENNQKQQTPFSKSFDPFEGVLADQEMNDSNNKKMSKYDMLKNIINEGNGKQETKWPKEVIDHDADFISFDDEEEMSTKKKTWQSPDKRMSSEEGELNADNESFMHDAEERKMLESHKQCLNKVLYEIPPWLKKDPKFCL